MFEGDDEWRRKLRAQTGIGTLIVFVAMVLVSAIAAGILFDTAAILQDKTDTTGNQVDDQLSTRLTVIQASGTKTAQDGPSEIGAIEVVTRRAPDSGPVDIDSLSIQWIDDTGSYNLLHENEYDFGSPNVDGAFAHTKLEDDDDSLSTDSPVINSDGDRAKLVIDIGQAESTGSIAAAYANSPSMGDADAIKSRGLAEAESASLRITTESGTMTSLRIVVPESLTGTTTTAL